MAFLGLLLGGLIALTCVATMVGILAAVIAWRVIAPQARQFTLDIRSNGIRAFTEHGEIEIGSFRYHKEKNDDIAPLEKSKRRLTVGDDGELVEMAYDEELHRKRTHGFTSGNNMG